MRNQPDEYFAIAGGTVQRESCPERPRKTTSQIHGGITGNLSVLSLYCFRPAGVASNPLRICHTCQRVKLARTFAPRTPGPCLDSTAPVTRPLGCARAGHPRSV